MEDGNQMNNLNILYEDNHIIVVEKQPGILSQADKTNDVDMLTIIKKYLKEKYNKPGNVYLGLVHRLDRMVGGVMVFAKTSKAASRLSEQIRNKRFKKEYMCIVNGILESEEGHLENYLVKDSKTNKSRVTTPNLGKQSILDYKVFKENKNRNLSLLKINLQTGRHHQIRVQLSNLGYPIYGDIKYNKMANTDELYLYAYKLSFEHPTTKEYLTFTNYPKNNLWDIMINEL